MKCHEACDVLGTVLSIRYVLRKEQSPSSGAVAVAVAVVVLLALSSEQGKENTNLRKQHSSCVAWKLREIKGH